MVRFLWLKLISIFGVVSFPWIYAKNISSVACNIPASQMLANLRCGSIAGNRRFKYGTIQNTRFASNKQLNILVYWTPSYVIIYWSYVLSKMVQFFLAHPVYVFLFVLCCNLHTTNGLLLRVFTWWLRYAGVAVCQILNMLFTGPSYIVLQ